MAGGVVGLLLGEVEFIVVEDTDDDDVTSVGGGTVDPPELPILSLLTAHLNPLPWPRPLRFWVFS